ncbi:MAG TPA: hypothetical protein VNF26_06425 [Candidatus Baltobacterales bacterium]|nr:hypothetical protein [Candidatus Baltobacterales bacterium]
MNKRPGQLNVVTEVGYCPFCERPRNLRREERHLGALVRMMLTCETCHRTLESTMGVAGAEKPVEKAPGRTAAAKKTPARSTAPTPEKRAPAKKAATGSPAAAKPRAKASTATKAGATTTAKRPAKGK